MNKLSIMTSNVKKYVKMKTPFVYDLYNCIINKFIVPKNTEKIKNSLDLLQSYRSTHTGESCLIIGNGSSLCTRDLEKGKSMISFASNKIFNIFEHTDWRPTYYCIADRKVYLQLYASMEKNADEIFIQISTRKKYPYIKSDKKISYIKLIEENFYPEPPRFSDNMVEGIFDGHTVTYMMIQLAVYMGFKQIYLLGIDHNYSQTLNPDGTVSYNTHVKDHFSNDDICVNPPSLYKTTVAYQAAKKYADEHGIKIYNATRGGKLEVFERVDFDSLFPNDGDKT